MATKREKEYEKENADKPAERAADEPFSKTDKQQGASPRADEPCEKKRQASPRTDEPCEKKRKASPRTDEPQKKKQQKDEQQKDKPPKDKQTAEGRTTPGGSTRALEKLWSRRMALIGLKRIYETALEGARIEIRDEDGALVEVKFNPSAANAATKAIEAANKMLGYAAPGEEATGGGLFSVELGEAEDFAE